ncbi:hypothetical protein STEG23_030238, partial [Scotinomys teguina]
FTFESKLQVMWSVLITIDTCILVNHVNEFVPYIALAFTFESKLQVMWSVLITIDTCILVNHVKFVYMVCYIDRFSYVELSLQLRDETYLIMVSKFFRLDKDLSILLIFSKNQLYVSLTLGIVLFVSVLLVSILKLIIYCHLFLMATEKSSNKYCPPLLPRTLPTLIVDSLLTWVRSYRDLGPLGPMGDGSSLVLGSVWSHSQVYSFPLKHIYHHHKLTFEIVIFCFISIGICSSCYSGMAGLWWMHIALDIVVRVLTLLLKYLDLE